jgi:hypothetical protein
MDISKMSFNKRIRLVKKETFDAVIESSELGEISSRTKDGKKINTGKGYYTLRTIFSALHPAMDKYDIDLEIMINKDNILCIWYDCIEDKKREVLIDFSSISGMQKLPLMNNMVQSDGAVKSYIRRYALTTLLNLNSTDDIEERQPKDQPKSQYTPRQQQPKQPTQPKQQQPKKITNTNLKAYYATIKEKGFTTEEDKELIDSLVKEAFQLKSKNDWLDVHYGPFMKFMKEADKETIKMSLERKIQKRKEKEGAK